MKQDNKLSLIGLANKAGKTISGEELLIKNIQQKKVEFVIISEDASYNTRKRLTNKCSSYNISYTIKYDRYTLGNAIGKTARVAIGITDSGFGEKLKKIFI